MLPALLFRRKFPPPLFHRQMNRREGGVDPRVCRRSGCCRCRHRRRRRCVRCRCEIDHDFLNVARVDSGFFRHLEQELFLRFGVIENARQRRVVFFRANLIVRRLLLAGHRENDDEDQLDDVGNGEHKDERKRIIFVTCPTTIQINLKTITATKVNGAPVACPTFWQNRSVMESLSA